MRAKASKSVVFQSGIQRESRCKAREGKTGRSFVSDHRLVRAIVLATLFAIWPNVAISQGFFDRLEKNFKDAVDSVEGAIDSVTEGKEDVERVEKKATDLKDDLTGSGDDTPRYDKPWITEIQAHLAALGYNPGPADGVFGKGTQNAVRAYQSHNGLAVNGAPNGSLMTSLREARQQAQQQTQPQYQGQASGTPKWQQSGQPDLSSLYSKSAVELTFETQDRLNKLGYNTGVPDGQYGNKTRKAIIAYQKDRGIPVTGKVTPELVASLRQAQGGTAVSAGPKVGGAFGPSGGTQATNTPGGWIGKNSGFFGSTSQTNQPTSLTINVLPGPPGPGLVAVEPVMQDGRLLTGYPINRGRHSSATVQFLARESNRAHVELARYLDLVVLKSDPKVLDKQHVAYRYARRFLTKNAQQQFMDPCQTPSCMHSVSGVPYGGWIGGNEFQREQNYRNFLQAFRSKLMAMAPPSPAGLLQVMEVELGSYDNAEKSFPLRIIRNQTVLVGIQTAYGLKWDYEFTLPVSIPVSREKAEAFIGQFPKRKAFLALAQSVTGFSPSPYGNALSARMKLDQAALFIDQDLQQKAYDFGLHVVGENVVGIAAAGGATKQSGNGQLKLVRGPGGEELLEHPMPKGMNPIRFFGLNGLPVLGYPVQNNNGELSAAMWKKRHGFAPEVDDMFQRLISALAIRSQPTRLKILANAERFAGDNLDEKTKQYFMPTGKNQFGQNEFNRNKRHQEFLNRYSETLANMLPLMPWEFVYIKRIVLGKYNDGTGRFALNDPGGGTNLDLLNNYNYKGKSVPKGFPMPRGDAEALAKQLEAKNKSSHPFLQIQPIRNVFIAYRIAITGVSYDKYQRPQFVTETRSIVVSEDQLLKKPIYEFPLPKSKKNVANAEIVGQPFWPHYGTLLVLRDLQSVLTQDALITMTQSQVSAEQNSLQISSNSTSKWDKGQPVSNFEWQTVLNKKPELARGDLLNLFVDPNAKWDFLNRETKYGLIPDHKVNVFLFARSSIAGKSPEFAARDLAPVYREHLSQAIARLPETFYVTAPLPEPRYDFKTKELFFEFTPHQASNNKSGHILPPMKHVKYYAAGERVEKGSYNTIELNEGDSSATFYNPQFYDGRYYKKNFPRPKGNNSSAGTGPLERWRLGLQASYQKTSIPTVRAIGFDRNLILPRISMDRAEAERVLSGAKNGGYQQGGFRAVVEFDARRVSAVPGAKYANLFARLRRVLVLDAKGQIVAAVGAESFPTAASTQKLAALTRSSVEERLANCEAKATLDESRGCFDELCRVLSQKGQKKYANQCLTRQSKYIAERSAEDRKQRQQAQAKKQAEERKKNQERQAAIQRQRQCDSQIRSDWGISSGMPLYDEALQSCLSQEDRAPYGPDFVGLQLGMDRQSADALVKRRMDGDANALLREAHPFKHGLLRWSNDAKRGIAVFTINNNDKERVAGISRRLYFDDGKKPNSSQITGGLQKKYGPEAWSDGKGTSVWALSNDPTSTLGIACHELAEFLTPRDGWSRQWTRVVSPTEQAQQYQKRSQEQQARSVQYQQCLMELSTKLQSQAGHGGHEDMAKVNKEMAACAEKHGMVGATAGSTTAQQAQKLPLMIQPEGAPGIYAKYAACGPVFVSRVNLDGANKVSDASFVLFDPAWIASLPSVAFKGGVGATAVSGGKTKIDF